MFASLVDDLVAKTDAELDATLREIELEARRLEARRAAALAVIDARRTFRNDGHKSLRNYVSATCNSSKVVNLRERRRARLLNASEVVGDALCLGRIGVSQADELAATFANPRVADELLVALPLLVECAERLTFDDFLICVRRWVMLVDLDGSFRDVQESIDGRTAHVSAVGNTLEIGASGGDALTAESMIEIFQAFVDREFRIDCEARRNEHGGEAQGTPLPRSAGQRRFDAMQKIFATAMKAASTSEGALDGVALPEPVVNVMCDDATLDEAFTRAGILLPNGRQIDLGDPDADEMMRVIDELTADPSRLLNRRCETDSGLLVHPLLVIQAALTGHVRRVVVDSAGRVIDLGRKQRLFRGGARIAAQLAARHCNHLGCDIPATQCDIDHVDEWGRHGGRTDQRNGDPRCGGHDRFKHRARLTTRRSRHGRVYTRRADGTVMLPVGERAPDLTDDEMHRAVRARADALIATAPN